MGRTIIQAATVLDYPDSFAPIPVRIAQIGKHHALPADFEKVPFEKYLYIENLSQGYLNTQSDELLLQMAQVLYSSVLNLRDFLAENIGQEFTGLVAQSLDDTYRRYHH